MMENKKKKIAIGMVLMFLSAGLIAATPITENKIIEEEGIESYLSEGQFENEETYNYTFTLESKEEKKETYKVGIGPIGTKSSKECTITTELTKEEAENLQNELFSVNNKSYSTSELVQKNINLLKKYDIISNDLYENITNLIVQQHEYCEDSGQYTKPLVQVDTKSPKIRFGPTLFFYASAMSQYTFIDDPTNQIVPFFNITRLNKILEIFFNIENPIFSFTKNVSCSYYSKFTTWQIGIGGSVSIFASVGFLPNQNYYFFGPFLGVFIFPVTLIGIYIFKEIEDPNYPGGSFEMPYLDIIIGMPLIFSLVLPGWYVTPENFD